MNISFTLTTEQVKARSKFVTRRLGWRNLKPGQVLTACEKCQGLRKGQHPVKLGKIRVKSVRRERLDEIEDISSPNYGPCEVINEGFPGMRPMDFVAMFCKHNGCTADTEITRIEFEYL